MTYLTCQENARYPHSYTTQGINGGSLNESAMDTHDALFFTLEGFEFAAVYNEDRGQNWDLIVGLAGVTTGDMHQISLCESRSEAVEIAKNWLTLGDWDLYRGFVMRIFLHDGFWMGHAFSFNGEHYLSALEDDEDAAIDTLVQKIDDVAIALEKEWVNQATISGILKGEGEETDVDSETVFIATPGNTTVL